MAMNLHTQVEVHVKLDKELQGLDVEEYLFTPDGNITSRFVYCEYCFFLVLLFPFFFFLLLYKHAWKLFIAFLFILFGT